MSDAPYELKKGDLVKILEKNEPGIRPRDGGLGRVHRIIHNPPSSPHYDIEYILGGRLLNITRSDIVYTTADEEGLTDVSNRNRRKRKSSVTKDKDDDDDDDNSRTSRSSISYKKQKRDNKTKSLPGSSSSATTLATGGESDTASITKNANSSTRALELFERHRREFERCLKRLEGIDGFAFFTSSPSLSQKEDDDSSPSSSPTTTTTKTPFDFNCIRARMTAGRYVEDRIERSKKKRKKIWKKLKLDGRFPLPYEDNNSGNDNDFEPPMNAKGVNWKVFRSDVLSMCDAAIERDPAGVNGGSGTLGHAAAKIKELLNQIVAKTGSRQIDEMDLSDLHLRIDSLIDDTNKEAAVQGVWRTTAFRERKYKRLIHSHALCEGLSDEDQMHARRELVTSLEDQFVGIPYCGEEMEEDGGVVSGDGVEGAMEELDVSESSVIRAQVKSIMEYLLISVQDRVMTQIGVLQQKELTSGTLADLVKNTKVKHDSAKSSSSLPDVIEQPVWGIDCYTRKNIMLSLQHLFGKEYTVEFMEQWLLPAINATPVDYAHDMTRACRILEGRPLFDDDDDIISKSLRPSDTILQKLKQAPPWVPDAAKQLRQAKASLEPAAFRIHPKGHGSVILRSLPSNTFITYYRGEIYPAWRWGEKTDAIELTQVERQLKPTLPDFYNMVMERPRDDPRGYGLLFVDASRKAGLGSSFSHSCDPTCEVKVVAVGGRLNLAMTTVRDIQLGEELTFDYNAVTESLGEYLSAVCLCGHAKCRGSFLHFTTADCYQQVMARNSPLAVWFASLVKCSNCLIVGGKCYGSDATIEENDAILERHGFKNVVFGAVAAVSRHNCSGCEKSAGDSNGKDNKGDDDGKEGWKDCVPVWLRTYVADVLRYVEYERRTLPVALMRNNINQKGQITVSCSQRKNGGEASITETATTPTVCNDATTTSSFLGSDHETKSKKTYSDEQQPSSLATPHLESSSSDEKPIPGSRPPTSFLHYSRARKDYFISKLKKKAASSQSPLPKGMMLSHAVQKLASTYWKNMTETEKNYWKKDAIAIWERSGGREKEFLEKKRKKRLAKKKERLQQQEGGSAVDVGNCVDFTKPIPKKKSNIDNVNNTITTSSEATPKKSNKTTAQSSVTPKPPTTTTTSKISFETADAEGRSAMEQRIQSLAQSLSRVGRILAHHRQETQQAQTTANAIHPPLSMLTDEQVITHIWSASDGLVPSLIRFAAFEPIVSPALFKGLKSILETYSKNITTRETLSRALLELRRCLLTAVKMGEEYALREEMRRVGRLTKKKKIERRRRRRTVIKEEDKEGERQKEEESDDVDNDPQCDGRRPEGMGGANEKELLRAIGNCKLAYSKNGYHRPPLLTSSSEGGDTTEGETDGSISNSSQHCAAARDNDDSLSCNLHNATTTTAITHSSSFSSEFDEMIEPMSDSSCSNTANASTFYKHPSTSLSPHHPLSCTSPLPALMSLPPLTGTPSLGWNEFHKMKYKLESAADVLLLYAHTTHFFKVRPFKEMQSTPIDVYARELGNEVPRRHTVKSRCRNGNSRGTIKMEEKSSGGDAIDNGDSSSIHEEGNDDDNGEAESQFCDPNDVVAKVVREYNGFYVFSQLLQWFNGGIGTGSNLPNMLGCILLPDISTCFADKKDHDQLLPNKEESSTSTTNEFLEYKDVVRPLLKRWMDDRIARGSPWNATLMSFFDNSSRSTARQSNDFVLVPPLGSPILDCLLTGDDSNIQLISKALSPTLKKKIVEPITNENVEDTMSMSSSPSHHPPVSAVSLSSPILPPPTESAAVSLTTVTSEALPAPSSSAEQQLRKIDDDGGTAEEGIADWVQCEKCKKWRKLPSHVDVNSLPEKFYCKDNIWNKAKNSCEDSEDEWDLNKEQVVRTDGAGSTSSWVIHATNAAGAVESDEGEEKKVSPHDIVINARFDIYRPNKRKKYIEGVVKNIRRDSSSNRITKVKFHYVRLSVEHDEWVKFDSGRIFPLHSHTKKSVGGKKSGTNMPKKDIEKETTMTMTKPLSQDDSAFSLPRKKKKKKKKNDDITSEKTRDKCDAVADLRAEKHTNTPERKIPKNKRDKSSKSSSVTKKISSNSNATSSPSATVTTSDHQVKNGSNNISQRISSSEKKKKKRDKIINSSSNATNSNADNKRYSTSDRTSTGDNKQKKKKKKRKPRTSTEIEEGIIKTVSKKDEKRSRRLSASSLEDFVL